MRTILLKRMESSLAALTSTVRSLVDYLNLFLARLDQGRVLTPKQAYKLRGSAGRVATRPQSGLGRHGP